MAERVTYQDYVGNADHMREYRDYQKRYATKLRESDRVLLDLLKAVLPSGGKERTILDVGCSTGNLLLHMKHALGDVTLIGADLDATTIEVNRKAEELAGIEFRVLDILKLEESAKYDVVTLNAILFALDEPEFDLALRNIARSLKPGGALVVFDMVHPFEQGLEIIETSKAHPRGLRLAFRPTSRYRAVLEAAGFKTPEFRPFHMPFDLPRTDDPMNMTTYTVTPEDGKRLSFRGALYQPWCHVTAQIPA